MSINSKQKGKRGELEWVHFLRDRGIAARRGVQYSGDTDSPDVVSSIEGVHWEVKRTNALRLYPALDQAFADADDSQMPVVAHRADHKGWVCILAAPYFIKLLRDAGYIKTEEASKC